MKSLRTNRLFHWICYVLIRAVMAAMDMLPAGASKWIGVWVGRIMYVLDGKRRRTGNTNLRKADPPVCSEKDTSRMVRKVFEHYGLMMVEMLRVSRTVSNGLVGGTVRMERLDIVDRLLKKGNGVLIVIAHLGNWEVVGLALARAGYPLNSLARPVGNPYLNTYLNRFRTRTGQRIIPSGNALQAMSAVLQQNGLLVIQADLRARRRGVPTKFFGRTALAVRSPALLSLRHSVPIVPAEIYRENGHHVLRFHEPISPPTGMKREEAVVALTQEYTSIMEEFIRRNPTQWLWIHRRWKGGWRVDPATGSPEAPSDLAYMGHLRKS